MSKNVNNRKAAPKLIFFNEKKILGSSLAFTLKEGPVRCVKVCNKSWVILLHLSCAHESFEKIEKEQEKISSAFHRFDIIPYRDVKVQITFFCTGPQELMGTWGQVPSIFWTYQITPFPSREVNYGHRIHALCFISNVYMQQFLWLMIFLKKSSNKTMYFVFFFEILWIA